MHFERHVEISFFVQPCTTDQNNNSNVDAVLYRGSRWIPDRYWNPRWHHQAPHSTLCRARDLTVHHWMFGICTTSHGDFELSDARAVIDTRHCKCRVPSNLLASHLHPRIQDEAVHRHYRAHCSRQMRCHRQCDGRAECPSVGAQHRAVATVDIIETAEYSVRDHRRPRSTTRLPLVHTTHPEAYARQGHVLYQSLRHHGSLLSLAGQLVDWTTSTQHQCD